MLKVILTKGLPASGKTTWAKQLQENEPGRYKRVNKDDLRAMLDAGQWSKANENFVLSVRDQLILQALEAGKHVIVDDTNLAPKHRARIEQLVKGKATVEVKEFDASVDDCIARDLKRASSVGEKVIRQMYRQFLAPAPEPPAYVDGAPHAILVDLDGTLALMGDRSPYAADLAHLDTVNEVVRSIVTAAYCASTEVVLMSGRQSEHRLVTEKWLLANGIEYDALFMRPEGDMRKDSIVKRELFDAHVRGNWNIDFVLDDRNQVVDMWRNELGLICLQVAEGDF